MASNKTLSPEDWAQAALDVIAAGGVDALSVEGLARDLGVTKGSFYWHFADRSALVSAALDLWEQTSTADVIAAVAPIADPGLRLAKLAEVALGGQLNGPVDVALLARANDPLVAPVIHRVNERRLKFLEATFAEQGWPSAAAARQARIAYAAYVGHFVLRRALPRDKLLGKPVYLAQFVNTFAPPAPHKR